VTFTQVLGADGGLGTLKRVTVSKRITNGHYDIRVIWSDGKTHSLYQWDGWHYSTDDRDIWGAKSNLPVTQLHEVTDSAKKLTANMPFVAAHGRERPLRCSTHGWHLIRIPEGGLTLPHQTARRSFKCGDFTFG
jgi:hypothetical protein